MSINEVFYRDFVKFDIRVGEIISAGELPKTRKLVEFKIDIGKERPITVIETFAGKIDLDSVQKQKVLVIVNIVPRKLMGFESEGILLATELNGRIYLPGLTNLPKCHKQ